ncbi:MAG TPA: multiprotein bridging factor aMBF1 [Methanosarcina vacuolata]|uniref:multiprotein bridging factor aMBF1 n=1 Tax=Methanosarcina sp. Kolksee TaxID=1434099 RepID=UPI00064E96B8|nr:multiprotein bridging factor aMBF1 [Methanosarcina sp. Kolksee]HNW38030.1 multiprotein bridging factor aMBF1 [Methanosarcina vacuolata]HPS89627.1 multiprotein bridging factor aMBF1 [Methanosarcina vacuolata]
MQCEICGAEIRGKPICITIDNSELQVCQKCAPYGKPVDKRTPVSRKVSPVVRTVTRTVNRPKKDFFDILKDELLDNYDQIIRDAREAKGWSQEDLAENIKEKVSLIKKIERSEIVPEDSVRKKLEHALDIKLTERLEESGQEVSHLKKDMTLGDIVKIKRK